MKNKLILGYGLYALSLIALLTPTVILFVINRDVYLADNQVDLSLGAILTLFSILSFFSL